MVKFFHHFIEYRVRKGKAHAMGIRCFLAIELPQAVQQLLLATIAELTKILPTSSVRWVNPQHSHLTLHFLGNAVGSDVIAALLETGKTITAQYPPLALQTGDLVVFPNFGPPKVVGVACDGPGMPSLKKMRTEFGAALTTHGVAVDRRPWQPHVTLGRFRDFVAMRPHPMHLQRISFTAQAITLYQSTLTPSGPHYDQLDRFACTA